MEPDRTVSLSIPARADHLVLVRLALSAVCRLTSLRPDEVADLKLAVTEAATSLVGEEDGARLSIEYRLLDDRLELALEGASRASQPPEEVELGLAILAATVDSHARAGGRIKLVKYLMPAAH